MIIVRIRGGLGNQLFQYSAGYALAKKNNDTLCMDSSFYSKQSLRSFKLDFLNITYSNKSEKLKLPFVVRLTKNRIVNRFFRRCLRITSYKAKKDYSVLLYVGKKTVKAFNAAASKNIYVDGYFMSEDFFNDYRDDLLKQFSQKYETSEDYLKYLTLIKGNNSVAVHIRRGDFLKAKKRDKKYYLLTKEYYERCFEYMNVHLEKPVYFFFSDDINWVKENFGTKSNYFFVSLKTNNPDIDEMMLMKSCKNIISANSTFSWWAAWLNTNSNPIVLVPNKEYGPDHMIPNRWIKIEV